jgi:hypothetical protein
VIAAKFYVTIARVTRCHHARIEEFLLDNGPVLEWSKVKPDSDLAIVVPMKKDKSMTYAVWSVPLHKLRELRAKASKRTYQKCVVGLGSGQRCCNMPYKPFKWPFMGDAT